jgi:hypothetical protein
MSVYEGLIDDNREVLQAIIFLVCEEVEGGRDFSLTFFPRAKWREFIDYAPEESVLKGRIDS